MLFLLCFPSPLFRRLPSHLRPPLFPAFPLVLSLLLLGLPPRGGLLPRLPVGLLRLPRPLPSICLMTAQARFVSRMGCAVLAL